MDPSFPLKLTVRTFSKKLLHGGKSRGHILTQKQYDRFNALCEGSLKPGRWMLRSNTHYDDDLALQPTTPLATLRNLATTDVCVSLELENRWMPLLDNGIWYGFPTCCIGALWVTDHDYMTDHPLMGTGFIPCRDCADRDPAELIAQIQRQRICPTPFPIDNMGTVNAQLRHIEAVVRGDTYRELRRRNLASFPLLQYQHEIVL